MSNESTISSHIRDFIQEIIQKNKLDSNSIVNYSSGSEEGDGYLSKTLAVDIACEKKSLNLFLKHAVDVKSNTGPPLDIVYKNESYFYDTIYTEFLKFAQSKGIQNPLKYISKCYGASPKNIIAFENVTVRGFEMFDRKKIMDEAHILSTLKVYAEYHAMSLAMRDQLKEEYNRITSGILSWNKKKSSRPLMLHEIINDFISKLDQLEDKLILSKKDVLLNKIPDYFAEKLNEINEYSVIIKGDCWVNNMMFLYKDENEKLPSDIMLIDWQLIKQGPLVQDLSNFFYTTANKEQLSKLRFYLKQYYKDLSKNLIRLGSDPEVIYPHSIFKNEWKEHCLYGFLMAFIMMKFMVVDKQDAPDMVDLSQNSAAVVVNIKTNQEYYDRMKILTEHMIENDFI